MEIDYKFSSKTVEWGTPKWLFDKIDSVFHFSTDVCADDLNRKCERFFSKEQDGLRQEWRGVCWMNPPYGRGIIKWVKKAKISADAGATVVCLIPSKTGTLYFQEWILPFMRSLTFVKGRLKFEAGDLKNAAPSDHVIVVFSNNSLTNEQIEVLKGIGFTVHRKGIV